MSMTSPIAEAEVSRLAVLAGPEVHPAKTRDTTTRIAPKQKERDVLCFTTHRPTWLGDLPAEWPASPPYGSGR